ncbi:tRNA1(Val) (adenine(37)-N6)-methyltransferase [Alsobacter sp. SYSU BS001988]
MPSEAPAPGDEVSTDLLLGGRLRLLQPARGHRAGTDAALLAAAAPADFAGEAVDIGASTGAVGLSLALRARAARVRLVELDPRLAALAERNVALNGLEARVTVTQGDILAGFAARRAAGLAQESADLALTNPPYLDASAHRASPDGARSNAHVMPAEGLEAWIKAAAGLLRSRGALVVVHRADALPAVLRAMGPRFGDVAVLPVHPRAGEPASRVLVRGVKGGRGPFRLCAGIVLHQDGGAFTPFAEALHRGEAALAW